MKKKVIAGILAFICTVNMFAVGSGAVTNTKLSSIIPISDTSLDAYAAGLDPLVPEYIPAARDYYNNAYYNHSIEEITSEEDKTRWSYNEFTYGIVVDTISHKEGDEDVVDAKVARTALVGINEAARIVSAAPGNKAYGSASSALVDKLLGDDASIDKSQVKYCTVIADGVFEAGAKYLKYIDLKGIVLIGANAFQGCKYITEVTIPDSVQYIGENAFADSGIKTVIVDAKLTEVPTGTFKNTPLSTIIFKNQDDICKIGKGAFANTTLTAYPLTNCSQTVIIDKSAFEGCTQLASLKLPDNVTYVGDRAFSNCTALKDLTTGAKCGLIGHQAFEGCSSLTSIKLNGGLGYIGHQAFKDCISLVNGPDMPSTLSFKASGTAFSNSSAAVMNQYIEAEDSMAEATNEYLIGNSYTAKVYGDGKSTAYGLFEGCTALRKVTLPESSSMIPQDYCKGCTSLTSITFDKDQLREGIQDGAFSGCVNLQETAIEIVPRYIGREAFKNCSALRQIPNNKTEVVAGSAFENCTSLHDIDLTSYICLDSAFKGCTGLVDANLTNYMWGTYIFSDCTNLESAYLLLTGATSTPDGIFNNCVKLKTLKNTDLSTISIIGNSTFTNCSSLESLSIPNVLIVDDYAFDGCTKLKSICSGDITIQDYGAYSFRNCEKLAQDVNANVSTIDTGAFEGSGIKSLNITGTVGTTLVIKDTAFKNCKALQKANINLPNSELEPIEYEVGENIFEGCSEMLSITYTGSEIPVGFVKSCTKLNTVTIPRAQDVLDSAFEGCESLSTLSGVKSFASIGSGVFKGCSQLKDTYLNKDTVFSGQGQYENCTSLTFAGTLYSLTDGMFKGCSGLKEVELASQISNIPTSAFEDCVNLDTINLGHVKTFDQQSFKNSGLKALRLFECSEIGYSAFEGCADLHTVDLEVNDICDNAFYDCGALSKATISANTIGANAFDGCTSLYLVTFPEVTGYSLLEIGTQALNNTMLTDVLIPDTVSTIDGMAFGYGSESVAIDDFTIYGKAGSEAETYANSNDIKFLDASKYDINGILQKRSKPGDVNGDGLVSIVDAVLLQRWLLGGQVSGIYGPNMDVNGDGAVNVFDLCIAKQLLIEQEDTSTDTDVTDTDTE